MKPRKVAVVLEMETDLPLSALRKQRMWNLWLRGTKAVYVVQAQANVIKPEKVAAAKGKQAG